MKKEKIQIPYKILLNKMIEVSDEGRVKIEDARRSLVNVRLSRSLFKQVMNELKQQGLIEFENCWYIKILVSGKDLI